MMRRRILVASLALFCLNAAAAEPDVLWRDDVCFGDGLPGGAILAGAVDASNGATFFRYPDGSFSRMDGRTLSTVLADGSRGAVNDGRLTLGFKGVWLDHEDGRVTFHSRGLSHQFTLGREAIRIDGFLLRGDAEQILVQQGDQFVGYGKDGVLTIKNGTGKTVGYFPAVSCGRASSTR